MNDRIKFQSQDELMGPQLCKGEDNGDGSDDYVDIVFREINKKESDSRVGKCIWR